MEENKRLRELKLALYINRIDKVSDKIEYTKLIKLLGCVALTLGKEYHDEFVRLTHLTVGGMLLRATEKELVATGKKYFTQQEFIRLTGMSRGTFYSKYKDLYNTDFVTQEYLDSLKPVFTSQTNEVLITTMLKFIENFKYALGTEHHDLENMERTLELEFMLIYNKLLDVFHNVGFCYVLIRNVCYAFDIEYGEISQLLNHMHIINRSYPNFRYNNRYLMQEIVTLYTHKGLSKGTIGSKVLGKNSSYLYNNTNKKFRPLSEDDMAWQYTRTIDWKIIQKSSVKKFINLFHTLIRYDL